MNETNAEQHTYNKISRYILVVFLFLQPLILNPNGWNIYAPLRISLLYFSATLMFMLILKKIWFDQKIEFQSLKIFQWLLFLFICIVISTVLSIHLPSSLYGNYPRFEGLLTWSSYFIIFLAIYMFFNKREHVQLLINAMSVSSIIISCYAISQFFGFDVIDWGPVVMGIKRSFASLGNPVSLGVYLSLLAPLNIYFAIKQRNYIFIIAVPLNIIALIMTFSIGAWLGFAASLLVLILLNLKELSEYKKLWTVVITILVLFFVVFSFLATPSFKARLTQMLKGRGSLEARLLLWKNSSPLVVEKPLFGTGPDTFQISFVKNLSPEYERKVSRNYPVDRAHNEFLNIAMTMGLATLAVYIGLLYFIFDNSRIALRSRKIDYFDDILRGSVAAACGFLVSVQTFFGTYDISPLFWAILGLVLVSSSQLIEKNDFNYRVKSKLFDTIFNKTTFVLLTIIALVFPVGHGIKLISADYYYKQAKLASRADYQNDSFYYYDKAISLTPFNGYYIDEYGKALMTAGKKQKSKDFLDRGIKVLNELNRMSPLNSYYYLDSGRAYTERSFLSRGNKYILKAKEKYDIGLELDPNYAAMRFDLAIIYLRLGEKDIALSNFKKVIELKPSSYAAYVQIAKIYKSMRRIKEARFYALQAVKIQPTNKSLKDFYSDIK